MTADHEPQSRSLGTPGLYVLSILIGVVGGLGAALFRDLIAFFHNLLFLGRLSAAYDVTEHTPASPWGVGVILVPAVGALGVAYLVKNFAPEAKGTGVPEVMDAIYYGGAAIRPVVAVVKAVASALSIGSGGSIGREGPIIQIGSAFGSAVGQVLSLRPWQRVALVAAGAGAGIAATFDTPIGGVLFAMEILLHEVSVRTLVPVALAAATATYVGRVIFGPLPSFVTFHTPYFQVPGPEQLVFFAGLGALLGLVSALFIKSIYGFVDFFDRRVGGSYYRRHVLGMLAFGVTIYLLLITTGHYYVEGLGYATVQDVLLDVPIPLHLLVILFALKLFATSLTLGSGASGGIFSPTLFLGATLGAAYGLALQQIFHALPISPAAFTVAGMAGVVGGVTGAAMAAIVMILEMTLDYNVAIPVVITVALAYGIRRAVCEDTIYTSKLVRRGRLVPRALFLSPLQLTMARDVMDVHVAGVPFDAPAEQLARTVTVHPDASWFLVESGGRVQSVVPRHRVECAPNGGPEPVGLGEIAADSYVAVPERAPVSEVVSALSESGAAVALVTSGAGPGPVSVDEVQGVVTRQAIADVTVDAAKWFD